VNVFQKQLLINGKPLADLPDLLAKCQYYGPLEPPRRVSAEEFERDMREALAVRGEKGK
jgi:hypothetical protein